MYSRILVPTDGSLSSQKALCTALGLATLTGAEIELFHVTPPPQSYWGNQLAHAVPVSEEALIKLGQKAIDTTLQDIDIGNVILSFKIVTGYPLIKIIEETHKEHIDLIVMGSQGKHSEEPKVGNLVKGIVEQARVPIVLVRAQLGEEAIKPINIV